MSDGFRLISSGAAKGEFCEPRQEFESAPRAVVANATDRGKAFAREKISVDGRAQAAAKPLAGVLEADENAVLGEAAELQLLAQGTDLELASSEWLSLAAVTLDVQAVRQTYEAELATCRQISPGRYQVDVPSYPAAGNVLRARLQAQLGAALGASKAAAVLHALGAQLDAHFGGFGVSAQDARHRDQRGQWSRRLRSHSQRDVLDGSRCRRSRGDAPRDALSGVGRSDRRALGRVAGARRSVSGGGAGGHVAARSRRAPARGRPTAA